LKDSRKTPSEAFNQIQEMTTLSNNEILAKMKTGELVKGGDEKQIGPACYELRIGSIYYDLTENGKRLDAANFGGILIKPGHLVVLITLETLEIPKNLIARVSSKGSLFSIGLSPVSTYADPGFAGKIGLVTQNLSDRYIEIPIGESVAKVDFSVLSSDSSAPYQGQHGFQTQIWPIKSHLQKTYDQVKGDSRVESEAAESFKILPASTANSIKYLQRRQLTINFIITGALIVNTACIAFAIGKPDSLMAAVAVNLFSSVITGAFSWFYRPKD
jgi:dCTP deaminase